MSTTTTTSRRYLIAGNWKCNGTLESIQTLIKTLNNAGPIPENVDVVVCPSFLHVGVVQGSLREDVMVGSQTVGSNVKEGAYTGEICATQLIDHGITHTIVGHSERRTGFDNAGESNSSCANKALVAIRAGLHIIFCIGETQSEREQGITSDVMEAQLDPLIHQLSTQLDSWSSVTLAYEPVWAIGTGLVATPELAQETHHSIREYIKLKVSNSVASQVIIQYGGSMKGTNAKELLQQPDIDGGLIGGASLKGDFWNIINSVEQQQDEKEE